jgi:methionine aminopeptidase
MKRSRSMSLHALKKSMDAHEAAKTNNSISEEVTAVAEPRKTVKVARVRRAMPSAGQGSVSAKPVEVKVTSKSADKKSVKLTDGRARSSTTSNAGIRRTPSAQFRKNLEELEQRFEDAMEASEDEEETVMNPTTMTKYKECGRVVDAVLDLLAEACVAGANTKTLCDTGDEEMMKRLKGLFTKTKNAEGKRLARGIAYPTNISVNETLCNDSPFRLEDGTTLKDGDVVKVHLGCHLDGYPVSAARTIVVGATTTAAAATTAGYAAEEEGNEEETQQQQQPSVSSSSRVGAGNAIEAARVALLAMVHALRPGTLNADITDLVAAVGNHFGVQAVEGVLSNRTKRWVPDGMDCIIGRRVTTEDPHQDVGDCEIDEHQVWCLDAAFTNNDNYRITLSEKPVTLFRRTPAEFEMDARVKQANEVLQEITADHFCFPFHFKSLENPLKAKLGIHVLQKKGIVDKLSPLRTKSGYTTARFSATVAVTAKRVTVLCGAPPPTASVGVPAAMRPTVSVDTLPAEVQAVLQRPYEFADARVVAAKTDAKDSSSPAMKRKRIETTENEE